MCKSYVSSEYYVCDGCIGGGKYSEYLYSINNLFYVYSALTGKPSLYHSFGDYMERMWTYSD